MQPHIELIKPTVQFDHYPKYKRLNKRRENLGDPSSTRGPKQSNKKIISTPSLATCDEMITLDCLRALYSIDYVPTIVQTVNQSFNFNGESDLDLEYAMGLTNPQTITLLQTGDIVEGMYILG
ncbi:hypothetical protein H0H87_006676 [Tephrocybe sp. NHM501043]|nr:hypothetical protein H0H87_006676 [Tephrocybe sp. NHM501043]